MQYHPLVKSKSNCVDFMCVCENLWLLWHCLCKHTTCDIGTVRVMSVTPKWGGLNNDQIMEIFQLYTRCEVYSSTLLIFKIAGAILMQVADIKKEIQLCFFYFILGGPCRFKVCKHMTCYISIWFCKASTTLEHSLSHFSTAPLLI